MTIIRLTEMREDENEPGAFCSTGNHHRLHSTEAAPLMARLIAQPMVRAASGNGEPWKASDLDLDLLRSEWSEAEACPVVLDRVHAELVMAVNIVTARWLLGVTTGLVGIEVWEPFNEAFTEALDGDVTHRYTLLRLVAVSGLFLTLTGSVVPDVEPLPAHDDQPASTLTWYRHAQLVGEQRVPVCEPGCDQPAHDSISD